MKSSLARKLWLAAALFGGMFALLLLLLYTVEVRPIGPLGSSVGLASLNGALRDAIGTSTLWYTVSEQSGELSFVSVAVFAVIGVRQLARRKSLKQVDSDLYLLALLYITVAVCYLFFELVVINCRPVLEAGSLKASFPSSHTLLVCTLMGSAAYEGWTRLPKPWLKITSTVLCTAVALITVVGRLLSGVHWASDILGGLLLSAALVLAYAAACQTVKK